MSICRDDYFPFYDISSVTLEVICGAYTSGVVDITASIISTLSGQINYSAMDHTISAAGGTAFLTELSAGDSIVDAERPYYIQPIYSVDSNTSMETVNMVYYDANTKPHIKKVNTEYLITPAFLGMSSTTLPDGEYTASLTIVATVGGSTETFVINSDFAVICNNFCCIYEKLAEFADMCDDCLTNENIKRILDTMIAWGLMEAYLAAPYCGDTTSFATLNAKLTEICNSTPCKNC
jgi:hypothetical protein